MSEPARSYHGQPVIKEPVWTWEIPTYFFTGGMGGAAAGLAYLCELRGNQTLASRSWGVALVGVTLSPALLTSDLGKPARFLNMLRMFKVTSPMSVGSWVLAASGTATATAAAHTWTGRLERPGRAARPLAALLGLPLSTYTAALIADTAVPVWHEARQTLPFVFASGAALSAGAAAVVVTAPREAAPARRLALAGAVLEVILKEVMERRLGDLAGPYGEGSAAKATKLSRACTVSGAALLAARGGGSRVAAALGGSLLCGGALSARWSIFKAGFQSAADPKYVVDPQRTRIESGARRGAARRHARVAGADPASGSPASTVPKREQPARSDATSGA